jgi:hypothetical protein
MTDRPTTDPSPADADAELASAYLDGEATTEEMARVEAEPRLGALVAELDDVRHRLAVDPPGPRALDDHVAAALAEFDALDGGDGGDGEAGGDGATGAPPAAVASMDERRERRPAWYRRIPLGAAAAVIVLVALVGAAATIDVGSDDETAAEDTAAQSEELSAAGEAGSDEAAAEAPAAGTFDTGDATIEAFGGRMTFEDNDALVAFVTDEVLRADATADAPAPSPEAGPGGGGGGEAIAECDPVDVALASAPGGASFVTSVAAVVAGRDVTAVVTEDGDDRRVAIVEEASCAIVDERVIAP